MARILKKTTALGLTAVVVSVLAVVGQPALSAVATAPVLAVDLGSSTGPFDGGATGALYALGKDGVPNDDVVAPLHIKTIDQKPEGGAQHPSGDALNVAPEFFRTGGSQEFINLQDFYAGWYYPNPGLASYQQTIASIVSGVAASPYNSKFVLVPFNEPDNIWYDLHSGDTNYASSRDQFFQDWKTVYQQIRQQDPGVKIGGPNTSQYDSTFIKQFLTFAKANNVLPDVMTWHELLQGWTPYRAHYADYRSLEQQVGVSSLPINIDEYAARSEQSVPGKMIQWLTAFEDTKVDAMQAFWGTAEDIQGNVVRQNEANSSWWLMRWYGALSGNTVQVTPPSPNTQDTVQAIATLDVGKKQSRILLGGGSGATTLSVSNVPTAVFGTSVHVQVQQDLYSGWDATAPVPQTILESDYPTTNGAISVPLPNRNADAAYQVILTPSGSVGSAAPASPPAPVRYEVENAAITDATLYTHYGLIDYPSSNGTNMGAFNKADSRVTYTVNAPATGQYELDILYGSGASTLTQQIMQVDGGAWQFVTLPPTLDPSRNSKKTLYLPLAAGSHTITFGVSDPSVGNTNSDDTQDAIDLTLLAAATTTSKQVAQRYEAEYADLSGSVSVATSNGGYSGTGYVSSSPSSQASSINLIVQAGSDGYYDLSARYRTAGVTAAAVTRSVDGQTVSTSALPGTSGAWAEAAQLVWLKAGINQVGFVQVAGVTGFDLDRLDVTPLVGSTAKLAPVLEAESGTLAGHASVQTNPAASGGQYVGNIGGGTGNTLTFNGVTVPTAGTYAVNVGYANAEQAQSNNYNSDLIDRYADVTTTTSGGSSTQRVYFKNTYCWSCYQQRTFYVALTAGSNSIQFANAQSWAPDIDTIQVAAVVQPTSTIEAEASTNTPGSTTAIGGNATASNARYVGYIGNGASGSLTINGVAATATGSATVLIRYATGDTRTATLSVNGGTPQTLTFPSTGSFSTWADLALQVPLNAGGSNSITISNSSSYAPDIDKVTVIG